MASITLTNLGEILAGIKQRQERLNNIPKVAKQMGVLAVNEIKPLCAVKSGNWRDSIHAEVHPQGSFKVELWVGSKGAFAASGYNYGALQERTRHPIEIGFHRSIPTMTDLWQQAMHGQASRTVGGLVDEFASMAGF